MLSKNNAALMAVVLEIQHGGVDRAINLLNDKQSNIDISHEVKSEVISDNIRVSKNLNLLELAFIYYHLQKNSQQFNPHKTSKMLDIIKILLSRNDITPHMLSERKNIGKDNRSIDQFAFLYSMPPEIICLIRKKSNSPYFKHYLEYYYPIESINAKTSREVLVLWAYAVHQVLPLAHALYGQVSAKQALATMLNKPLHDIKKTELADAIRTAIRQSNDIAKWTNLLHEKMYTFTSEAQNEAVLKSINAGDASWFSFLNESNELDVNAKYTLSYELPEFKDLKLDAMKAPLLTIAITNYAIYGQKVIRRNVDSAKKAELWKKLCDIILNDPHLTVETVNTRNAGKRKLTALHIASFYGFEDIVELLMKRGADFDIKDGQDWSAADWAIFGKQNKILKSLSSHDLNLEERFWMESQITKETLLMYFGDSKTIMLRELKSGVEVTESQDQFQYNKRSRQMQPL